MDNKDKKFLDKNPPKEAPLLTRRNFIIGGALAAATAAGIGGKIIYDRATDIGVVLKQNTDKFHEDEFTLTLLSDSPKLPRIQTIEITPYDITLHSGRGDSPIKMDLPLPRDEKGELQTSRTTISLQMTPEMIASAEVKVINNDKYHQHKLILEMLPYGEKGNPSKFVKSAIRFDVSGVEPSEEKYPLQTTLISNGSHGDIDVVIKNLSKERARLIYKENEQRNGRHDYNDGYGNKRRIAVDSALEVMSDGASFTGFQLPEIKRVHWGIVGNTHNYAMGR